MTLQVVAVLIIFLFGYPGCSSNGQSKEKIIHAHTLGTSTDLVLTSK